MKCDGAHSIVVVFCVLSPMAVNGQNVNVPHRLRRDTGSVHADLVKLDSLGEFLLEDSVQAEDEAIWMRLLSDSMSMSMDFGTCVPDDVEEFEIEDDVNIGDTLFHPGPGFAERCGRDCYTVKDSGDDPPYDPEDGDTLRYAYRTVSSNNFSIRSRVCGVDCSYRDPEGRCGRVGLMVRETLSPFSKNIFAAHEPDSQAFWWYRKEGGEREDEPVFGFDGSPDVECLWISLEREGSRFTFSYDYEGSDGECELCECLGLSETVTIDMNQEVLVGLAVSSPAIFDDGDPTYKRFTTANFRDIEFRP